MKTKTISDEELVYLGREKNQTAINLLYKRYSVYIFGFISKVTSKWNIPYEINDLYQISWIKFIELTKKFNQKSGRLYFFVRISIIRVLNDYFKSSLNKKINYSLDESVFDNSQTTYLDLISESPIDYGLNREVNLNEVIDKLNTILKKEDLELLLDKVNGYSYFELADKYQKKTKAIDNKLCKIRRKLKSEIL